MDLAIAPDREARNTGNVRLWAVPASIVLHGAILAGLLVLLSPALPEPPVKAIAVDILTRDQFEALNRPQQASEASILQASPAAPAAVPAMPEAAGEADEGQMVRASHFFAADILADPANAEVRQNLPLFARDEQAVQICDMEALEQIAEWKADMHPDALVPYAFAETRMADGTLEAEGGAFRNAGQWYAIRFRCRVGADHKSVSSFEFAVGDLIPQDQWDSHFLNATDDPLD